MAQKIVLTLTFLVTMAMASNIVPRAYMNNIHTANNSTGSHHFILGNRVPGDRLVLRQNIIKSSSWLRIVTQEMTFNSTKWESITLVKALDQKTNGNGAYVSFLSGGPSLRNVTLRFKSQRGHGINFIVELYLASGDSMMSLSYQYLVGLTSVSNIIKETCEVIWEMLHPLVLEPPTEERWKQLANEFNQQWQFPHCIGALDGKHVVIQCPQNAGSEYYNYKGSHSIVLMAMCDANYIFTLVDIGAVGRQSDGGIFRNSTIGRKFETGEMNVPAAEPIYEGGPNFPYVIVADEAFPLTSYLMRPYPGKAGLTPEKRIFNYRLSRARRVIENAFGILASQWRLYRKPIIAKVENVEKMVQATICLHNWLRRQDTESSTYVDPDLVHPQCVDGSVRTGSSQDIIAQSFAFQDVPRCGSNMYSRHASMEREHLTEYFNEEGAVSWQFVQVHMM